MLGLIGCLSPSFGFLIHFWKQRNKLTFTQKGLALFDLCLSLHVLDYAYVVDKQEFIFPGYILVLMLLLGLSAFSFGTVFEKRVLNYQLKETLLQAHSMATLGAFAMEMAHEIRNPLTVISGTAHVLHQSAISNKLGSADLVKRTEVILNMAKRLNNIIRSVSRSVSHAQADENQSFGITQVICDTILLMELRAKKNNIELRFQKPAQDILMVGNAIEISQVLTNLIHNALDAIEDQVSEKWVEIRVADEITHTMIKVIDSGVGIPVHIQPHLFQNLFTTKPVGKGTGLGLGICKRIVENHKGELFYDKTDKNTCFVLRLPKTSSVILERGMPEIRKIV